MSVELVDAELRHLRVEQQELANRIQFVVRDQEWGTVVPVVETVNVAPSDEGFDVELQAMHHEEAIAIRWRGSIRGSPDGYIRFGVEAQTLDAFSYGRIGICVLHRAQDYASRPYVMRTGGLAHAGVIPDEVFPVVYRDGIWQPAVGPFTSLVVQLTDDTAVDFGFDGGDFEIEDQRNWTDATLKTYSTPTSREYPHWAPAGTRLRQAVTVRVTPTATVKRAPTSQEPLSVVEVGGVTEAPLPEIGTMITQSLGPESRSVGKLFREAGLDYVRIDVDVAEIGTSLRLAEAAEVAQIAGAQLEIGFRVTESDLGVLRPLIESLPGHVGLRRILILDKARDVTPARLIDAVRDEIGGIPHRLRLGGGTPLWFAEINRERPNYEAADFVAFGVSPQLHTFDNESIMESLASHAGVARAARELCRVMDVEVGPVVLRPRFDDIKSPTEIGTVDSRQHTAFCAAWTVGSFAQLTVGGATAVTYYEAIGPSGLALLREQSVADSCTMSPALWALAELHRLKAGVPLSATTGTPNMVASVSGRIGEQVLVVMANLTDTSRRVGLDGVAAHRVVVRRADCTGARTGSQCATTEQAADRSHRVIVELGPYEVVGLTIAEKADGG